MNDDDADYFVSIDSFNNKGYKGDDDFEAGVPESFNGLVKEIRSLGLSVDLLDRDLD